MGRVSLDGLVTSCTNRSSKNGLIILFTISLALVWNKVQRFGERLVASITFETVRMKPLENMEINKDTTKIQLCLLTFDSASILKAEPLCKIVDRHPPHLGFFTFELEDTTLSLLSSIICSSLDKSFIMSSYLSMELDFKRDSSRDG